MVRTALRVGLEHRERAAHVAQREGSSRESNRAHQGTVIGTAVTGWGLESVRIRARVEPAC